MPPITRYKDYKLYTIKRTENGVYVSASFYGGYYEGGLYIRDFKDSSGDYQLSANATSADIDTLLRQELDSKMKQASSITMQKILP